LKTATYGTITVQTPGGKSREVVGMGTPAGIEGCPGIFGPDEMPGGPSVVPRLGLVLLTLEAASCAKHPITTSATTSFILESDFVAARYGYFDYDHLT